MDVSEPNDDMEISSDHGYLALRGETVDVEVASMRDTSLEPDADPDFMIEDTMPEDHDGEEGVDSNDQGRNDDEMIDEDLQDSALNPNHDDLSDHEVQDEFDDTLDTIIDQHYELGTGLVHAHIREPLPDVQIEEPAQPETSPDVANQAEANPNGTSTNQYQDLLDETAKLDQLINEESAVSGESSHLGLSQTQAQVSEAFADETTNSSTVKELGDEAIEPAEETSVPNIELPPDTPRASGNRGLEQTSPVEGQAQNNEPPPEEFENEAPELHPVKVLHEGSEVFLFPPSDEDSSETFFLHDDSLTHQSLSILLKACREVLGNSVNDEEELEMEFHDLGLHTSEDSLHASQITMSQVVDVYLRLRRNEGDSEPQPLFVSLRTRPHFSSRFFSVAKAAEEGKGSSYLGLWQEPLNIDAQDPLSHSPDDKSASHLLEDPVEPAHEGSERDRDAPDDKFVEYQSADPNDNMFDEAEDETESKDQAHYGDYEGSSGEPTGIEPTESPDSGLKEQESGEQSIHGKGEDTFRTETDVNQSGSAGTSTLQGDDFAHKNDFTTNNDENLPPEGDFFDDAVQGYNDIHDGNFEFGLDEYGDHNQIGGLQTNDSTTSQAHPPVNHESSLEDEFGDSSFAFINADDYEHTEETSGLYEAQTQDSCLREDQLKSEMSKYEAMDTATRSSSNLLDPRSAESSAAITTNTKPTHPQSMSTPPDSLPGHRGNVDDGGLRVSIYTGEALDAAVLPTSVAKVNGSNTHTPPEQIFDDSDEINYEDEDGGTNLIGEITPKNDSRQAHESPKSTKRNRPDEDEEDFIEYMTPDPKRRRS